VEFLKKLGALCLIRNLQGIVVFVSSKTWQLYPF